MATQHTPLKSDSEQKEDYGSAEANQSSQPSPTRGQIQKAESEHGETDKKDAEQGTKMLKRFSEKDLLETIAKELKKELLYYERCDVGLRSFELIGCVMVVAAFGLLFAEDSVKDSDKLAAGGAAMSLAANIGLLLIHRKLRYETKKHIKELNEKVKSKNAKPSDNVVKTITHLSLQHKDSVLTCLSKCCTFVCCCTCCCQKNQGESNDGLSENKNENNSATGGDGCCEYLRSGCTFLLTVEFWTSTYNMVSPGWILSNNLRAISDHLRHKVPSSFDHMKWENQLLECVDLILALFSIIWFLVFISRACCKASCKACGDESFVGEIENLAKSIPHNPHQISQN